MILEVAILEIKSGLNKEFEAAFQIAAKIICTMTGYISHELHHCLANDQEWRALLHHFYDPFPVVEHYEIIAG
jgi:heme-degrading monooxygenase HmoA